MSDLKTDVEARLLKDASRMLEYMVFKRKLDERLFTGALGRIWFVMKFMEKDSPNLFDYKQAFDYMNWRPDYSLEKQIAENREQISTVEPLPPSKNVQEAQEILRKMYNIPEGQHIKV